MNIEHHPIHHNQYPHVEPYHQNSLSPTPENPAVKSTVPTTFTSLSLSLRTRVSGEEGRQAGPDHDNLTSD